MNSRRILTVISVMMIGACRTAPITENVDPFTEEGIVTVMTRAADWQLDHPKHALNDWTNAAFYAGIMATYRTTEDEKYLDAVKAMGRANEWKPGAYRRLADDHAIAQTYLDLARLEGEDRYYAAFRDSIDLMMRTEPEWTHPIQVIDYWWCDALFMSPPALAKLAVVTGDETYLAYMDSLWKQNFDLLYDEQERLFSRDLRYKAKPNGKGPREPNGEKIFWSRGNGWVLAGTARVLQEMPVGHPTRPFYVEVFREMATRIASLQPDDGLWRTSLLNPDDHPVGESSGTGFFTYALAWGINEEILPRDEFEPVVKRAWRALCDNVTEDGRLGRVQQIAAAPGVIEDDAWEVYGTGALLLAGSEVVRLLEEG